MTVASAGNWGGREIDHNELELRSIEHLRRSPREADRTTRLSSGKPEETECACVPSCLHPGNTGVIVVDACGHIARQDSVGNALLRCGETLRDVNGHLRCANNAQQPHLALALAEAHRQDRTSHLLLTGSIPSVRRYTLTVRRLNGFPPDNTHTISPDTEILCLLSPLENRRIASVRQLMELFGLSAAEARLARGVAYGDRLETYAREHHLKMSTIRTQMAAVFQKTGTDRQATLVALVTAIPAIRD